jgi:hypothetical protein
VKPCAPELPVAAVRQLIDQAGGPKRVCIRLNLSLSQVYAYADPGEKDEISFARVAALTDREAPAAAEYLAHLAGGAFLPMPAGGSTLALLTAEAMREHAEACAELVRAMADGLVTAAEAGESLEEIDQALRALTHLRTAVADIARGGTP